MARWEPGQSGNPRGRPPGGESFAEALREALTPEKRKLLAEKAVALAIEGNIQAMTFIADRLDGKPVQALEHSGSQYRPILVLRDWSHRDEEEAEPKGDEGTKE